MAVFQGWRSDIENRQSLRRQSIKTIYRFENLTIPETVDPRGWLKRENQRNMSSCVGNGSSTVGELAQWIASGGAIVDQLSRMFAYVMSQRHAGISGDSGSTISAASASAKLDGYCLESIHPYPDSYSAKIPVGAKEDGLKRRLSRHEMLAEHDAQIQWLGTGLGGILWGIPWTAALARSNGRVESWSRRDVLGGHAIAIVGYVTEGGVRKLIMANSHGEEWGDNGYAIWEPAAVRAVMSDRESVSMGMTDMSVPQQRPIPKPDYEL